MTDPLRQLLHRLARRDRELSTVDLRSLIALSTEKLEELLLCKLTRDANPSVTLRPLPAACWKVAGFLLRQPPIVLGLAAITGFEFVGAEPELSFTSSIFLFLNGHRLQLPDGDHLHAILNVDRNTWMPPVWSRDEFGEFSDVEPPMESS